MVAAVTGGGQCPTGRYVFFLFNRYASYLVGMPWAAVIKCVLPPIII